jgi:hypothetical protein
MHKGLKNGLIWINPFSVGASVFARGIQAKNENGTRAF